MRVISLFLLALVFVGCDQDPLSLSTRDLPGGYKLSRAEDGRFYVIGPRGAADGGGGAVGGTVQRIGWSDSMIVAERLATFRGDRDGLMVIDVSAETISGPFLDQELPSSARGIRMTAPSEAWEKLSP